MLQSFSFQQGQPLQRFEKLSLAENFRNDINFVEHAKFLPRNSEYTPKNRLEISINLDLDEFPEGLTTHHIGILNEHKTKGKKEGRGLLGKRIPLETVPIT